MEDEENSILEAEEKMEYVINNRAVREKKSTKLLDDWRKGFLEKKRLESKQKCCPHPICKFIERTYSKSRPKQFFAFIFTQCLEHVWTL